MPEPATLSDLLAAQSERKLTKMREGIVGSIDRLKLELRLVDDAIAKKRKAKSEKSERPAGASERGEKAQPQRQQSGRFQGLSRDELYAYLAEMGKPAKPAELARYLLDQKNIVRTTEATRVGLMRLEKDGRIERRQDGAFYVPSTNGRAPRPETEAPQPAGTLDFGSPNPDKTSPGE